MLFRDAKGHFVKAPKTAAEAVPFFEREAFKIVGAAVTETYGNSLTAKKFRNKCMNMYRELTGKSYYLAAKWFDTQA